MEAFHAILGPIAMLVIWAANLVWSHRRTEFRTKSDGDRLQKALCAELQLLAQLYRTNLKFLGREELRLLSIRSPMTIYRGNIGRLTLLPMDVIERVVAVHANNEHVEMLMAECAKSIKNGQCVVYHFDHTPELVTEFRSQFKRALGATLSAIEVLTSEATSPDAKPLSFFAGLTQTKSLPVAINR